MPGGGKGGGGSTSTVNVNNGPINVDSDSTVDVNGLDNIKVTAKVEPLQVTSKQDLAITQPIVTQSRVDSKADVTSDSKNALAVDLKPVVLDVCSTSTTRLPHGQISQPFNFHVGLTWFGMEFFGFNFGGESRTIMQDLPRKPSVDWPAQRNSASSAAPCAEPSAKSSGGLRVRIKTGH